MGWLLDTQSDTAQLRDSGGNTVTPGGSCSAEAVMDLYVNGSMDHEWDLWAHLFSFSLSF
jgi:hypothetical protein